MRASTISRWANSERHVVEPIVRALCEGVLAPILQGLVGGSGQLLLRCIGIRRRADSGLALCVGGLGWALAMFAGATAWLLAIA